MRRVTRLPSALILYISEFPSRWETKAIHWPVPKGVVSIVGAAVGVEVGVGVAVGRLGASPQPVAKSRVRPKAMTIASHLHSRIIVHLPDKPLFTLRILANFTKDNETPADSHRPWPTQTVSDIGHRHGGLGDHIRFCQRQIKRIDGNLASTASRGKATTSIIRPWACSPGGHDVEGMSSVGPAGDQGSCDSSGSQGDDD